MVVGDSFRWFSIDLRWSMLWEVGDIWLEHMHQCLSQLFIHPLILTSNTAKQIEFRTPTHTNARGCHESKNNSATENTDVVTTRTCFSLQWPWVATERKMFALLKVPGLVLGIAERFFFGTCWLWGFAKARKTAKIVTLIHFFPFFWRWWPFWLYTPTYCYV